MGISTDISEIFYYRLRSIRWKVKIGIQKLLGLIRNQVYLKIPPPQPVQKISRWAPNKWEFSEFLSTVPGLEFPFSNLQNSELPKHLRKLFLMDVRVIRRRGVQDFRRWSTGNPAVALLIKPPAFFLRSLIR